MTVKQRPAEEIRLLAAYPKEKIRRFPPGTASGWEDLTAMEKRTACFTNMQKRMKMYAKAKRHRI